MDTALSDLVLRTVNSSVDKKNSATVASMQSDPRAFAAREEMCLSHSKAKCTSCKMPLSPSVIRLMWGHIAGRLQSWKGANRRIILPLSTRVSMIALKSQKNRLAWGLLSAWPADNDTGGGGDDGCALWGTLLTCMDTKSANQHGSKIPAKKNASHRPWIRQPVFGNPNVRCALSLTK